MRLPLCSFRVRIRGSDKIFCLSPECDGEIGARPAYDAKYCVNCGWDKGAGGTTAASVAAKQIMSAKPRMSIDELAARRRRCRDAKARGEQCPDDPAQAAVASAPPPAPKSSVAPRITWTCGVTTVPARFETYLPATLASLAAAGFPAPRLFVDGPPPSGDAVARFNLPISARVPPIGAYGNWLMGLWELYLRAPHAGRYAMFQDDILICRNARAYLDEQPYPADGYWNLLTFPENETLAPWAGPPRQHGNHLVNDGPRRRGWFAANQNGLGAVALVFDRAAVLTLLTRQGALPADAPPPPDAATTTADYIAARPQNPARGHRSIDGGVVSAMKLAKRAEMVHYPSLVRHVGDVSQMAHKHFPDPRSWPGEDYDAAQLLEVTSWD